MKKLAITSIFGLALAITFGFGFIPSMEQKAACADCDTDNLPQVQSIFTSFAAECAKLIADGKEQPKKCLVANVYNKLVATMKIFSKDNRFGPGDRILFVGESQNGNLVAGANRTFQSGAPMPKDTLTVEVNKTDGRSGAIIKICAIDKDGNVSRVGTLNFAENNDTGSQSTVVTGVEGKVIRIQVASFGGLSKMFKYVLKTS
jgi:hypothetical protein